MIPSEHSVPRPHAEQGSRLLEGVSVCMLRTSDYSRDARARKQATTLVKAGASVLMVGMGADVAPDLADSGYSVQLLPKAPILPRLGRENVWWPVRVAVNLTYTRMLERRFMSGRSSYAYAYEPELFRAVRRTQPTIIHAYDIYTLPAAIRAKRQTGARVVYDVLDLIGDVEYIDAGRRSELRAAEAELIGSADAVITVCDPLADVLESRYAIQRPVVIFNGPSEVMSFAAPVQEPVRLLFQGIFASNRNLTAIVEAMQHLRGRATLALQGFGGVERELRDQVVTLGLSDVVSFVPPALPLDVVKSASAYDVGVICYRGDSLNLCSAVPNKLMDYLGAGLALAVSDLPGHRSVLEGTGAGVFIDPTSAETIAEGIGQLLADPERITEMKRSALETAKHYAWDVQAERLLGVYEAALGRTGGPRG